MFQTSTLGSDLLLLLLLVEPTGVEDLVEEAAHQAGSDVKLREDQRQTRVARLPQAQPLLALLVNAVAAQHALEQLRGEERVHGQSRGGRTTFTERC